jgi:hypothetical protein
LEKPSEGVSMTKDKKKSTEESRASWFENHVIVMGGDKEQEDKIKQALKARMAAGNSGG